MEVKSENPEVKFEITSDDRGWYDLVESENRLRTSGTRKTSGKSRNSFNNVNKYKIITLILNPLKSFTVSSIQNASLHITEVQRTTDSTVDLTIQKLI